MNEAKLEKFTPSSSFLELAEYDTKQYVMTLTFKNGSQKRYLWVFPTVWQSFKESSSHGSYFARMIKGKLLSVDVVKKTVGQRKSTPLKHIHKTRTLSTGHIPKGLLK